jgi:ABC-2 type transport system ATP-binding protein
MSDPAIVVDSVSKNFRLYHERNRYIKAAILRGRRARYEEFWALDDVSFAVDHGSTLGIIGSNGSGKSTMLKCLTGIYRPDKGSVSVNGNVAALLELGAGFHTELSGRENVYLNGAILGMSKKDVERQFDSIVEFAGLERFIDTPVKNFSSGMTIRLGFSIATHVEPEILLIDEVLTVGDQAFQRKSSEKIEEFRRDGRTIVVVSHSLPAVQQLCKEVVWLEKGKLKMRGPSAEVIAAYTGESYTQHTAKDADFRERWGTDAVRIDNIQLLSHSGSPIERVETNDPVTIRIRLTPQKTVPSCIVKVVGNFTAQWSDTERFRYVTSQRGDSEASAARGHLLPHGCLHRLDRNHGIRPLRELDSLRCPPARPLRRRCGCGAVDVVDRRVTAA